MRSSDKFDTLEARALSQGVEYYFAIEAFNETRRGCYVKL